MEQKEINVLLSYNRNENDKRRTCHKPEKDNAAEAYISYVVQNNIPKLITPEEVKKATEDDSFLQKVKASIANGRSNDLQLLNFSLFKEELSVFNGLILREHHLVIRSKLRKRTIDIAHHSHPDIVKTKQLNGKRCGSQE